MKISLGSDHAGFKLKERVKALLGQLGHEVKDLGTFAAEPPVDYPLFIRPAAEAVARGECERGIVFGGSGNGEAMVANKVHGVRCALCWNLESAQLSRKHNDANVLSLGERLIEENLALEIVRVWLTTEFEGGPNCSEKDRTHERIRIEEGPIDRGKIMKLACAAMLVKECGRDRNHRGEINRAELRHDPESNQRQQH
ncbi:MAG: ribose-5-phosphate isomerase [Verrucomicrobia bacterium]|nr:MAG: ribose-5-phosphate isomerase [Verrucomicrobiota bacterium]